MSPTDETTREESDDTLLGIKPIYLQVFPYKELVANKATGMRVLEEASELREAYDALAKASMFFEEHESEKAEEVMGQFVEKFFEELGDLYQAATNLCVAICSGNIEEANECIINAMTAVTDKNYYRGYYGRIEENNDEPDGTES